MCGYFVMFCCVNVGMFCNVCVYVCMFFNGWLCECFVMCVLVFIVFVLFRLCMFILICFVCTGVKTTATE